MKLLRHLIFAAMVAAAFYFYPQLPAEVPVHWNFAGEADNFASKAFGAFLLPGLALFFLTLFPLLAKIDPKKENYTKFCATWEWLQTLIVAAFAYFYGVQLFVTLSPAAESLMPRLMLVGVGVLFILLGNLMGKIRQNFFIGLKTPWTLSDPEVWQKSQRVGGWGFIAGGFIVLALAIFYQSQYVSLMLITVTFVMIVVPIVYSYLLYRRKKIHLSKD